MDTTTPDVRQQQRRQAEAFARGLIARARALVDEATVLLDEADQPTTTDKEPRR